jgi:preprotein translocase subunit SecE
MGVVRYVNMSFIAMAIMAYAVLTEFFGWGLALAGSAANPEILGDQLRLANAIAFAVSVGATLVLRRKYNKLALEIGNELSKVTFPTWEETKKLTIVVIIVTIIIALILGAFDYVWSQLSSTVYDFGGDG